MSRSQLISKPITGIIGSLGFSIIYLIFVSSSILGDILYWLVSKAFAGYAKIFFYSALLIITIDFLLKRKIVYSKFVLALLFYFPICFLIGFNQNSLGKEFFAHFSPFILAILGYSYGFRSESSGQSISKILDEYAIFSGYFLSCLVIIYYFLVKNGSVEYFGAGALFAYPFFYSLKNKFYFHSLIFYLANIFTGKRSVLIAITFVLLIFFIKKSSFKFKIILLGFFFLLLYLIVSYSLNSGGVLFGNQLDRYIILFKYLAENDDILRAVDLATSGRLYDVFAVIDRLGNSFFNWIFGLGFGATFTIDYSFSNETHLTHYSHVTPFSYLLLGGIVLFVIVYGKLLYEAKFAYKFIDDHFSMMFFYFLILGFGGAIFFTDTFVWVLIGIFVSRRKSVENLVNN